MCGIIGTVGLSSPEVNFQVLVGRLGHRGPDANGVFLTRFADQDVKLGHTRLSIIDLTADANQPFEKDGLVLIFNGEIYNYKSLRTEIEKTGITFRTNSDTEVILEAWRLWGAKSLPRLRGMFAFAIYDKRDGRIVLARDPFGIKPLFVLRRGPGIAFSSELKALLPILGSDAVIDDNGVIASLIYGWLPDEFCMYRQVSKLGPGRWLERRIDGTISENVYWDPAVEMAEQKSQPLNVE